LTAYLLDVNVLLALIDPVHVHNAVAHRWFVAKGRAAWATCPITENGLVRILSQPHYPNRPGDASVALGVLRQFCESGGHQFWPDDVTLRDALPPGVAVTHHHVTDLYLLALAASRGGWLATFDGRIPTSAVARGDTALEVIPA
jgi:toxin-antitoxin system PIN domain toxin